MRDPYQTAEIIAMIKFKVINRDRVSASCSTNRKHVIRIANAIISTEFLQENALTICSIYI